MEYFVRGLGHDRNTQVKVIRDSNGRNPHTSKMVRNHANAIEDRDEMVRDLANPIGDLTKGEGTSEA